MIFFLYTANWHHFNTDWSLPGPAMSSQTAWSAKMDISEVSKDCEHARMSMKILDKLDLAVIIGTGFDWDLKKGKLKFKKKNLPKKTKQHLTVHVFSE